MLPTQFIEKDSNNEIIVNTIKYTFLAIVVFGMIMSFSFYSSNAETQNAFELAIGFLDFSAKGLADLDKAYGFWIAPFVLGFAAINIKMIQKKMQIPKSIP